METKENNDTTYVPPTVLVAIDSPSVRKYVGMAIKMAGYSIIMAVDGDDAIEKIKNTAPQLVILDVDEKARKLVAFLKDKYATQRIPLIVLTQQECADPQKEFPFADSIIAKPFTFDLIVKTVKINLAL